MTILELQQWINWGNAPSERFPGRTNLLPEVIKFVQKEALKNRLLFNDFYDWWKNPEHEREHIGEAGTAFISPIVWESISDTLIIQCLENRFGEKYDNLQAVPKDRIVKLISGMSDFGEEKALLFAEFVKNFKDQTEDSNSFAPFWGNDIIPRNIGDRIRNSANSISLEELRHLLHKDDNK